MTAAVSAIEHFGVVGFNHRQLPARLRGVLALDDAWSHRLAEKLRASHLVDGVAFISTCNRQEIVISADHPAFAIELVRSQLHSSLESSGEPLPEPYRYTGADAVRHVLRVSASLDSLVVGERQITQQLRRSFDQARKAGWLDKLLNGLARISVENAKEVHQRTAIGAESVGVFTLAKDIVQRETAHLERPKVAVIGLGEIGRLTARSFATDRRFDLVLSSRRARTHAEIGTILEAYPFVPMSELSRLLREMDAVVLATGSSGTVVGEQLVIEARKDATHPLILVDIGIPPQAEAHTDGVAGTKLFNLDWFTTTGFGQRPQGREALRQAQDIVEEGVARVAEWANVRKFSGLFDSCVTLTEDYKTRVIPDLLRTDLHALTPEQQRQVFTSMHRLLTDYSEGIFQTLSRELNDYEAPPRVDATPDRKAGMEGVKE
jgi:glutamyl-tRNA reductase